MYRQHESLEIVGSFCGDTGRQQLRPRRRRAGSVMCRRGGDGDRKQVAKNGGDVGARK